MDKSQKEDRMYQEYTIRTREAFIKKHSRRFFWKQKWNEIKAFLQVFIPGLLVIFGLSVVIWCAENEIFWPFFIIMGAALLFILYFWIEDNRRLAKRRAEELWERKMLEEKSRRK